MKMRKNAVAMIAVGAVAALSAGVANFGGGDASALSFDEGVEINPVYQQYLDDVVAGNQSKWKLIPQKYILADNTNLTGFGSSAGALPAAYDLSEGGFVTAVKNQGQEGICWAYATTTAIESNLLKTKGITTSFSPKQLDYLLANDSPYADYVRTVEPTYSRNIGDGGSMSLVSFVLGSQYTPVGETDFFNRMKNNDPDKLGSFSSYRQVTDMARIFAAGGVGMAYNEPVPASDYMSDDSQYVVTQYSNLETKDLDLIKTDILNYGAVVVGTYAPGTTNCYDAATKTIIDRGASICDVDRGHALTIIGWDDNHTYTDANDEVQTGAFLLQNSWGNSSLFTDYGIDANTLYEMLPEEAKAGTSVAEIEARINNYDAQENVWLAYESLSSNSISFQSIQQTTEKEWDYIYDRSMEVDHTVARADNEVITAYQTTNDNENIQALAVAAHGVAVSGINIEYQLSIDPTGTGNAWQNVGSVYLGAGESGQAQLNLDQPVAVSGIFLVKLAAKSGASSVTIGDEFEPMFATIAYSEYGAPTPAPIEEDALPVPNTGSPTLDLHEIVINGTIVTTIIITTGCVAVFTLRNRKNLFHRVGFKKR